MCAAKKADTPGFWASKPAKGEGSADSAPVPGREYEYQEDWYAPSLLSSFLPQYALPLKSSDVFSKS